MAQFAHRVVSAMVAVILIAATVYVWRGVRGRGADARPIPGGQTLLGLVGTAAALYAVQVIVGALQIWTTLAAWTVALHLALGAAIWALLAAATFVAWFEARAALPLHDRWRR